MGTTISDKDQLPGNSSSVEVTLPSGKKDDVVEPVVPDDESGDESDDGNPEVDEDGTYGEGENSDGLGVGFEYDDKYMC